LHLTEGRVLPMNLLEKTSQGFAEKASE